MTRLDRTRREPRSHATGYRDQGGIFLQAAEALELLSEENETYGSAIALLAVHAGIAYADALTIGFGGRKATGAHDTLTVLFGDTLGNRLPSSQRQRLVRLLGEKDAIAYQGKYYPLAEARKRLKEAQQIARWAHQLLEERPA